MTEKSSDNTTSVRSGYELDADGLKAWMSTTLGERVDEITVRQFAGGQSNPTYRVDACLLYTSPSPRDATLSRMPSSA